MSGAKPLSEPIGKIIAGIAAGFVALWIFFIGYGILVPPKPLPISSQAQCIRNLRTIDATKQQWALENHKAAGDMPTWTDLQPYLGRPGAPLPKCPQGGTYILGAVSNKPTCSIPGHALP